MRPKFQHTLETYHLIAKDLHKPGITPLEEERLRTVLGWHKEKAAESAGIPVDRQEKIFRLQDEKMLRMEQLHSQLQRISRGEPAFEHTPDARIILPDAHGIAWAHPDGTREHITIGEICADRLWDIPYVLDAHVPKTIQKRFAIEETKRALEKYLDVQIATEEGPRGDKWHRMKYAALIKDRGAPVNLGHLAERMINGFLLKITLDLPVLFCLEYADIYHDLEQKIDLIIRRTSYTRGVQIESSPDDKISSGPSHATRGVQLMTGKKAAGKHRKLALSMERLREEKERIQEIILLKIGKRIAQDSLAHWEKDGRPPGGPDAYWTIEQKQKVLRELLKGMFTPEEIHAQCEEIAHGLRHRR